jgi:hypothetical protein
MYTYIGILLGARPILHISRIKVKYVPALGVTYRLYLHGRVSQFGKAAGFVELEGKRCHLA